jgi:hypothetical protein
MRRVTSNAPPMPDKSEVVNKLMQAAVVVLGILLGHALAALFHIPGI